MLIRYPGSKAKLAQPILSHFPFEASGLPIFMYREKMEYREPFFGAGAIGFKILQNLQYHTWKSVWINDKDKALVNLWIVIRDDVERLIKRIKEFSPTVDKFELYKAEDGRLDLDPIEIGFRKLALHQMSFSGFGVKSGSPLGGKQQDNPNYRIDCRWNPVYLERDARYCHQILNHIPTKITSTDYSKLLTNDPNVFVYLDPPYYEKGEQLYKHHFTNEDHQKLKSHLENKTNWLLSYDEAPLILSLYTGWTQIEPLEITYTVSKTKEKTRPKNREILIIPYRDRK